MSHSICVPARQVYSARVIPLPVAMALAAAGVVFYFSYFTLPGLLIGFSPDDLMNLTAAARETYSRHLKETLLFFLPSITYRPVGALFYKSMFDVFGFTPLPYRLACYALLGANLWLAWLITRRLAHCWRTAFLATLLFAYHGQFWPLYQSTGFCYDLLCFFFYGLAFHLYLGWRRGSHVPSFCASTCWMALYILCLGSKEMAVSLPVVILCYELYRGRPREWTWLINEGRIAMLGGLMTLLYLVGRIGAANSLATVPAYQPDFRLRIFLARTGHLLADALYQPASFWLALAVVAMAGMAALSRSRTVRLGLLWAVIGVLPIAFIGERGLAQAYLPAFALALAIAGAVRAGLMRLPRKLRGVILFAAVPALLFWWHTRYGTIDYYVLGGEGRRIQALYEQLEALNPSLPKGGAVLLVKDAFPENDWSSTFLVYLWARDWGAQVGRIDQWVKDPNPARRMRFDAVLSYNEGRLLECDARPFHDVELRSLPSIPCAITAIAYP